MKTLIAPSHALFSIFLCTIASPLFVPPHPFPTMADGHLLISLESLHPLLTDPGHPGTVCSPTQVPYLSPKLNSTRHTHSLCVPYVLNTIGVHIALHFQLRHMRASHDPRPPALPVVTLSMMDHLQKYTYLTCPVSNCTKEIRALSPNSN